MTRPDIGLQALAAAVVALLAMGFGGLVYAIVSTAAALPRRNKRHSSDQPEP